VSGSTAQEELSLGRPDAPLSVLFFISSWFRPINSSLSSVGYVASNEKR
jgi:hypothetical protein